MDEGVKRLKGDYYVYLGRVNEVKVQVRNVLLIINY